MALSKPLCCVLLAFALLAAAESQLGQDGSVMTSGSSMRSLLQAPKIDCPSACEVRCGKNWKNSMCNKLCNICCGKCSCVPSGTGQDTRAECPCYANMVNSKNGKPKCP